jgi:transposase InsO family protein
MARASRAELRERGVRCGENRVARLMRESGLQAKQQRVFSGRTTNSDHDLPVAPNRLDRQFEADAPNQKWTCDITYVATQEGWLYLAVVLDLPEPPRRRARDESEPLARYRHRRFANGTHAAHLE